MEMAKRIKKIRKDAGLRQPEFAEKIGVAQASITSYETGIRYPSKVTMRSICREFNINEEWLLTGKGDMYIEMTVEDEIASFVANVVSGDSEFWKNFIVLLARMTPEERDVFERKVREFAEMFGEK